MTRIEKIYLILILLFTSTAALFAQREYANNEIEFVFVEYDYEYHPNKVLNEFIESPYHTDFDDLFNANENFQIVVALPNYLRAHQVKSFVVKQSQTNRVLGYRDFDEDTYEVTASGEWLRGVYENSVGGWQKRVQSYYYNDSLLKMVGTEQQRDSVWKDGKKGVDVIRTTTTAVSGLYLNKRNHLFNYYQLKRKVDFPTLQRHWLWGTQLKERPRVLLKRRLKIDYPADEIFYISERTQRELYFDAVDGIYPPTEYHKSTYKNYGPHFFVLQKPLFTNTRVICGDSMFYINQQPKSKPVDYTFKYYFSCNEKGLQDTLYFIDEAGNHQAVLYIEYRYFS
ncbi:hypothetical protein [Flavobacterium sp. JP2137]|uniref:hypothetical protein n=1 Tax=Flavobacterium sp. JP2137 TaxID=3414510 RepID=UPI003D3001C1